MPAGKKTKAQGANFEQQDVLQAVIVADRYDERFAPITKDVPLALFPVANKPLISYTLDFLVSCGVQQIYVYCSAHASMIKDFLSRSKWNSKCAQCQISPIVLSDATSLGDVFRDIDQKALFETDFLVVHGDLIANISLEKALEEHRERRVKDKAKPIMTLLLRNCAPNHMTRTAEDDMVIALDSYTQQVLHYQKVDAAGTAKFPFPLKNFIQNEGSKFDIRYDLADAGIAICSPQVSQLFTDNFDYQTKEDFIKGILINEEFLGNQMHVHIAKSGIATRLSSMHMYDTISKAVISRWVYPYVPDNNYERLVRPWSNKGKTDEDHPLPVYKHMRRNVYVGDIKSIGKGSSVENSSIIGHGSTIGTNCKISNSVIGCNCVIGDGVTLKNVYMWNGVMIKGNCNIEKSIICDGVIVHENTKIEVRCVLAKEVEVGPDVTIPNGTVICLQSDEDTFAEGDDSSLESKPFTRFGSKSRGVLWSSPSAVESDEEIELAIEGVWGMSLSEKYVTQLIDEESDSSDDEISEKGGYGSDDLSDEEDRRVKLFSKEVKDSILRAVEENIKSDNLILEINSSKYAHNVTIEDLVSTVTKSAFEIACLRTNGGAYFPTLKKILLYLSPVFMNYNKSSQSQIDCLQVIERYCLENKHAYECLIKILMVLYENDIIAEEVILHWHKRPSIVTVPPTVDLSPEKLRSSVQKFIDWLEEAEEESSEDES